MAGRQPAAGLGRRVGALALTPLLFVITLGIGWIVWSVVEWRQGRTPSYRLLGLRIVRCSDERPIGLGRSFARSCICWLLILPTIVTCVVVGICFAMGASAPDGLWRQPRTAPWDRMTATRVLDERAVPATEPAAVQAVMQPIDLGRAQRVPPRQNGHDPS
jgi:hypothetical protein